MTPPHTDAAIAKIAVDQYGAFSRSQAHDAGLNDRQIRYRLQTGRFERITRHTFRIAGVRPSWRQRVMTACLAAGDGAAASHRTAAALHGCDGYQPGIVEITVPQNRRDFTMPGVVVHSSAYWSEEVDITHVDGIPVTTPARTLCTLAAVSSEQQVEHALDSAERDKVVARAEVIEAHADVRERGRTGVAALGRVLERRAELAGIPHSVLERRMLTLLEEHGIPLPACQVAVRRPDGRIAYIDFAYRDLRFGIEVDGNTAHATPARRSADNDRSNDIALRDIRLIRFTYQQVVYEPEYVARTVRSHLRAAQRAIA